MASQENLMINMQNSKFNTNNNYQTTARVALFKSCNTP